MKSTDLAAKAEDAPGDPRPDADTDDKWLDEVLVTEELLDFDIEQVLVTEEVPAEEAERMVASAPALGHGASLPADGRSDSGEDDAPPAGIRGRVRRWLASIFGG